MQKIFFFLLLLSIFQKAHALEIYQIRISEISAGTINISLDTEAEELYYFHSHQTRISGNTINIDAFFVEGFGSTIAYLNNNFQIPIHPKQRMVYKLNVKIYYIQLRSMHYPNLQDEWSGSFSTPLSTPIFLTNPTENDPLNINLQNPNPGFINIDSQKLQLDIFDDRGEFVESNQIQQNFKFSHLPDGQYYFRFSNENGQTKTIRVLLKK